MQNIA